MKKIGIVGATGYTGEELLKTLSRHDGVEVVFATSERLSGESLTGTFPQLVQFKEMSFCSAEESLTRDVDLVFLCLHAGDSAKWAQKFLQQNVRVIDLGSDFRFRHASAYVDWYNMQHPHPELLPEAVYGLTEWHRREVADARLVGNPGCYPTSVLLPLLPFIKKGLVADAPIIVDSKSGVSGAGKKANDVTHFVSVNENLSPYKVGRAHRHVGEMEKEIRDFGGGMKIVFTPHLTPLTRGMLSAIYFQPAKEMSKDALFAVLDDVYADESFVHIFKDRLPSMKTAQNSNFCFISLEKPAGVNQVILFSAIDNLGKGASTQAVQNMNCMFGFDETRGLLL